MPALNRAGLSRFPYLSCRRGASILLGNVEVICQAWVILLPLWVARGDFEICYQHMRSVLAFTAVLLCIAPTARANDAAASTAVGGIQLKREARISMEKERLTRSETKVIVEYEFLNETDRDITTEVAFPVPPYDLDWVSASYPKGVKDFHLWVEGQELKYQTEAKAMVHGSDESERLRRLSVDVSSFGHFDDTHGPVSRDIESLPRSQRLLLAQRGLTDKDGLPTWTVVKTYHWNQIFPGHKVLHVRHDYAPVLGFEGLGAADFQGARAPRFAKLSEVCLEPPLRKRLVAVAPKQDDDVQSFWVDYILTTANTWKKPIKQFELVVERPKPEGTWRTGRKQWYVSFCWDGQVQQRDQDHFVVKKANFIPSKELRVMFFGEQ